jgi:pyrroline-5-carboxylate reductase
LPNIAERNERRIFLGRAVIVGFLGAGQMATALARGWIAAGVVEAQNLRAWDVLPDALARWSAATGGRSCGDNREVRREANVVVLAVKPQALDALLAEIGPDGGERLYLSIVAGANLVKLQTALGADARVVRAMPNTPCLIGAGACGLSAGARATPADVATALRLFRAVGVARVFPESLLDAVTGLSGSGPAFAFAFVEALADGGVFAGLPRDAALEFAAQTVLGAARMVLETGEHPGVLKDRVASPSGTTIAGLAALERAGFRSAALEAVVAAAARATQLGSSK